MGDVVSRKNSKVVAMPKEDLDRLVQNCNATVQLDYSVRPDRAKKARNPEVDKIFFRPSDSPEIGNTYSHDNAAGRMTVLRTDDKDISQGFPVNKDVYIFVCASDGSIYQRGPYSKGEQDHWMSKTPEEYNGWPVVGK